MVLLNSILFLLGLVLLVKGSGFFVESVGRIAKKLGVSEFVIGLTLVAVGTSLPELIASGIATFQGHGDFALGNVFGSNIANIGLIIGLTAMSFSVLKVRKKMFDRDGLILMFISGVFYFFLLNGVISTFEGIILLLFYLVYLLFLFTYVDTEDISYKFTDFIDYFFKFRYLITIRDLTIRRFRRHSHLDPEIKNISDERIKYLFKEGLLKDFIIFTLSGIAIFIGGTYLVKSTIFFAGFFGLPLSLVSLSAVAIGTSLPELTVSIVAARKGFSDIIIGNIIGSNIANILLVIGVSSIIGPLSTTRTDIFFFGPVMLFFTIVLLSFMHKDRTLRRLEGLALFVFYIIFMLFAFYLNTIGF